jgi:Dual specificity phosphatase, catalytic domain
MWRGGYFAAPDAVELLPGLYIGAEPGWRASRALARAGITQAVDLRSGAPAVSYWPSTVAVSHYPMVEYEAPGLDTLNHVSNEVVSLIQRREIVYLHCRAGVQRAPLVACAALMQMGWPLSQAFQLVRRRQVAALTDAQLAVLRKLSAHLEVASTRVEATESKFR